MNSIRKWLYRPKKSDTSLLAQFYFVDEDLALVASELDSFDGRKDPERCTMLVNQLRVCQDKVLTVIQKIMDDAIPQHRANRDFRVKFPDDVLQDSLSGQLWFGAECLAAGSSILNREVESASMRPLSRALTKNLDSLRNVLREQCLKTVNEYTERIREALVIFDKLFAEFELSYVSAMVPVKTMKEYDMLQEVTVLFSETVQRALSVELLTQDMLDDYDPALMFTIPRLAIVCGLLVYPEGPLNPDMDPTSMTEMFRPFQTLLFKIRELLYTLNTDELSNLEKSLCSSEEPQVSKTSLAGQGLECLQIDQGFDEEGEGIVAMDLMGSNILIQASGSTTPVTPVNADLEIMGLESLSPSSTIIDDSFGLTSSGLTLTDSSDTITGLNKSESQDSGLQSENISTSDTVTVDCVLPAGSNPEPLEGAAASSTTSHVQSVNKDLILKKSPDPSRKIVPGVESIEEGPCGSVVDGLCDTQTVVNNQTSDAQQTSTHTSTITSDSPPPEAHSVDLRHFCQDLVCEIVENALLIHCGATGRGCETSDTDNNKDVTNVNIDKTESEGSNPSVNVGDGNSETGGATGVSRQFSWQYNIQFASQNCHRLDPGVSERNADGGSISSDSTLSDQGAQDSVSDFVIETLCTMTQSRENGSSLNTSSKKDDKNPGDNVASTSTAMQQDSKQAVRKNTNFDSNQRVASSSSSSHNSPRTSISLTIESSSQIPKSQLTNKIFKQRSKVVKDGRAPLEHINCKTGPQASCSNDPLDLPVLQALKDEDSVSSSYSSCQSTSSECDCEVDCNCAESETSSCNSENNDEEEIALAIQAAELASRNEARSRFRSSSDLIHRLFVCIAGVADQLQTNYASDLRHILKCVFELNSTNLDEPEVVPEPTTPTPSSIEVDRETLESGSTGETGSDTTSSTGTSSTSSRGDVGEGDQPDQGTTIRQITNQNVNGQSPSTRRIFDEPPEWDPDDLVERCTACKTSFTFVRRRHHCRNCGKIFCGKCSSTTVPLPQYGHQKPVRVCHKCFLYQIAHFTM